MKILVLPGDGIGPEITQATMEVLDRVSARYNLGLEWDQRDMGLKTLRTEGSTLPESVMAAARATPAILLGP
ncbi:MAG TPA: isocitrate/isopropylmalate family dehydrogenase, partial [Burkholderiales bacterium]|nr:isocitrate/isopropylmalate family dehydrogenase [Burkholderiales bacterium]